MDNSLEVPQKIKNGTTVWSSNPTSRYTSKGNEIPVLTRWLYSQVHCGAIHNGQGWKQPRCTPVDERVREMWYVYTMEYSTAIEEGNPTIYDAWADLKGIMLSEISQTENKYCMISFAYGIKGNKLSAIRWISSRNLRYSMVTTVSRAELCTSKNRALVFPPQQQKQHGDMWGEGCVIHILQYTWVSNHHIVYLQRVQCSVSSISKERKNERKKEGRKKERTWAWKKNKQAGKK